MFTISCDLFQLRILNLEYFLFQSKYVVLGFSFNILIQLLSIFLTDERLHTNP